MCSEVAVLLTTGSSIWTRAERDGQRCQGGYSLDRATPLGKSPPERGLYGMPCEPEQAGLPRENPEWARPRPLGSKPAVSVIVLAAHLDGITTVLLSGSLSGRKRSDVPVWIGTLFMCRDRKERRRRPLHVLTVILASHSRTLVARRS